MRTPAWTEPDGHAMPARTARAKARFLFIIEPPFIRIQDWYSAVAGHVDLLARNLNGPLLVSFAASSCKSFAK
jgi:hypothetical protein